MEVCVGRAGVLKGARVCAFITSWTITSRSLGQAITLDDYRAWWNESERSAYRHQREFRAVFPELATPQPIADAAIARADEWLSGGVAAMPADVLPA
jgi:hypothetical protein